MQEVETLKANEKKLPNWPKCRPLIYHNIRDEIPEGPRNLVKRVYFSWFCNIFFSIPTSIYLFICFYLNFK